MRVIYIPLGDQSYNTRWFIVRSFSITDSVTPTADVVTLTG